jgi:cell division protein FtsB
MWGLSIALCVLLVNSLLGENGYLATVRTEHEEAALSATVARLRFQNQQLQEQGRRLASDPSALEEAARRDLNFIKPGETLVIIHDADANAPGAAVK